MNLKPLQQWTFDYVLELLPIDENDLFDFKQVLDGDKEYNRSIEKDMCAFANSEGGFLIFGVSNKKPRTVLGLSFNKGEYTTFISNILINSQPQPKFDLQEVFSQDGVKILIVYFYESKDKPVRCSNGSYYLRLSSQSIPMSRGLLENLILSKNVERLARYKLELTIKNLNEIAKNIKDKSGSSQKIIIDTVRLNELNDSINEYYRYFKDKDAAFEIIKKIYRESGEVKRVLRNIEIDEELAIHSSWASVPRTVDNLYHYMKDRYRDYSTTIVQSMNMLVGWCNELEKKI